MFAYPINPLDVSVSDGIEEVKILRENLKFKATYVYTDNYYVAKNNNKLYHFLKIR